MLQTYIGFQLNIESWIFQNKWSCGSDRNRAVIRLCSIPFKNNYHKELLIILNSAVQLDYSRDLNCISTVVKCVWFCVRNFANIMSTPICCECTSRLVTSFHHAEIAVISFSLCLSSCEEKKRQTKPPSSGARLYW